MTEAEKAKCVAWCEAHARKWQVLNRSRWKYTFHEKTLVRFVEEVQLREDEISLLLEFLSSDECISTLSLYDQSIDSSWKPTRAWLEISNKSVGNVHAIRLYHGLMTESNQAADGPYIVENGCASKVTFTYYWKQVNPPVVPASSSGVSYQVTGFNHDTETGLYTYAIEKRERVQQDLAEYLVATNIFQDVKEEQHFGVKQSDVAATGQAPSAENGKIVRRKLTKNSDCTTNIDNDITIEKPVSGASEQISVSLTGSSKVVVNRNMPSKADDSNLDIGESIENAKTEGGLWNQTIRTRIKVALLKIAESCTNTIFAHRHSTSNIQGDDPGFTHADEASNGRVVHKQVSRTSDGSYRIDEDVTQEKSVSRSAYFATKTLHGTDIVEESRGQGEPLSTSGLKIGESVQNTQTEGGRWNTTKRTAGNEAAGKISESRRETKFDYTKVVEENVKDEPQPEATLDANGKMTYKSVSKNAYGTYDVRTTEITAKGWKKKYQWTDYRGKTVIIKYHNLTEQEYALTEEQIPADAIHKHIGDSVTENGLHSGSITWGYYRTANGVGLQVYTKTGKNIPVYRVRYNEKTRKWQHAKADIKRRYFNNWSYSSYWDDWMRANPKGNDGDVLAVKLVGRPRIDDNGNEVASWLRIDIGNTEPWEDCDNRCEHVKAEELDYSEIIENLLK